MVDFVCSIPAPLTFLVCLLSGCCGAVYCGYSCLTYDKKNILWGYLSTLPFLILLMCLEIKCGVYLFRILFIGYSILVYLFILFIEKVNSQ